MNATIRTVNWGGLALASLLSGWLATLVSTQAAMGVAFVGTAFGVIYLALSPYRHAVLGESPSP